jgi:2-keto-4-pentenoate hydratase/2-oxohepta-3-ene-1,7-dioic acid hydratase in catechol pathway
MEPDIQKRRLLKSGGSSVGLALLASSMSANSAAADQSGTTTVVMPLAGSRGVRLATCQFPGDKVQRIGVVLDGGQVIDVQSEAKRHAMKLAFDPLSMLSLLANNDAAMRQIESLVDKAARGRSKLSAIHQVRFLSPIPRPQSNIYCVGWNYLEHFEEGKDVRADKAVSTYPEHPVFFTKGVHTMNNPDGTIPYETGNTETADWEAELAVVIGKKGRDIPEDQAMDYVFGYAAFNDTTVREIQQKRHGGQWFKGKSMDGYGPMGPWIVTAGGVELDNVRIICRVNGVEKQNGSYQQMYFKIPRIIAELSRGLTLEPGDIIATGTPPGVGYARKPPEFLKPDDVMETEVTGVGSFRNVIKEKPKA